MNPGTLDFPPNAIDTIDHLRAMAGKTLGELAEHVLTTPKTSTRQICWPTCTNENKRLRRITPNGLRMVRLANALRLLHHG